MKKSRYSLIGIGILIVLAAPLVVGALVSIPSAITIENDWIGFFGGYIGALFGGLLTFGGVLLTLKYYKDQNTNQKTAEKERNIALLYWNVLSHKQLLDGMSQKISKAKPEEPLVLTKSYSDYDYEFYFNKLPYVLDVLDSEEVNTLILFYHSLAVIEEHRVKGVGEYKDMLVFMIKTCSGASSIMNERNYQKGFEIDHILNKLKPYADAQCKK